MFPFLSRVAFIGNLFFLLMAAMHQIPNLQRWDAGLVSFSVVMAYLGILINIIVNIFYLVCIIKSHCDIGLLPNKANAPEKQTNSTTLLEIASGKNPRKADVMAVPKWLQVANFIFLILQILYFQFT